MRIRDRRVFLSVAAQEDNLGDIEIRQAAVDIAASGGRALTVFTGTMSKSYVATISFPAGTTRYSSGVRFAGALASAVLARRAHLMLAPGPYVLPRRLAGHAKAVVLAALAWLITWSGGQVIAVGRAVSGRGGFAVRTHNLLLDRCRVFAVRDIRSEQVLGRRLHVAPDLALLHRRRESTGGGVVVFSFRGDVEVESGWFADLVRTAREDALSPVLVTQVRRDDKMHQSLAEEHGVELVEWGSRTHGEQLARVKATYERAEVVVSNRLHAIVFGLQAGAAPVAATVDVANDKVVKTLGHLLPLRTVGLRETIDGNPARRLTPPERSRLESDLDRARDQLRDLTDEVNLALSS